MLGEEMLSINHLMLYHIAQLTKRPFDHVKGFASVVTLKVLDIFEHKRSRPVVLEGSDDIKKQRTLRFI